jgi:hypothetical protein
MTTTGTSATALAMNNRIGDVLYRMFRQVRSIGPYLALALVLPGGSVLAFLLWIRQQKQGKR